MYFIVHKKPVTGQELKGVTNTYFEEGGNFKVKLASNSYKKSGKIGEELNSWINSGSLAKITSGAHGSLILSLLGAHLR